MTPAVAGRIRSGLGFALVLLLVGGCGSTRSANVIRPSYASEPPFLALHWMSFSHHQEPREQLLFEGGQLDSFTELRVLAADGTVIASGAPVASATQVTRMCGGQKGLPSPDYGALRVTVNLASQQQLHDFIASTEQFSVEVLTPSGWQRPRLAVECHAME